MNTWRLYMGDLTYECDGYPGPDTHALCGSDVPHGAHWVTSAPDWAARWFDVANGFASWSKDRAMKVGCVIVGQANQILTGGYNGFPRGVDDNVDSRHERPDKYLWTEHAERNAIYNAARHGVALDGATIYTPYFPCANCSRAIIQVGIIRVFTSNPENMVGWDHWQYEFRLADEMLSESSVEVFYVV
jgi:dCMP deaminase